MSHIDRIVEAIHNPPDDILSWLEAEYQQEQDNILVLEYESSMRHAGIDPNKPNLVISNAGIRVKALCSSTSL